MPRPVHALYIQETSAKSDVYKQGKKLKVLQNNVPLFGQLCISMQSCDGDLREFFPTRLNLSLMLSQNLES